MAPAVEATWVRFHALDTAYPMTETAPQPTPPADDWQARLTKLREQHPGQKDSILFCVHKLEQDSTVGLRDIRDEAARLGVPVAGRALHSAKLLLGLAAPKPRATDFFAPPPSRTPTTVAPAPQTPVTGAVDPDQPTIEDQVLTAVRQIQSAAGEEATRLRAAIQQAVAILQDALDA